MTSSASRGFTLIELMTTIAVLAIGSALAYPSFSNVIKSNRVATSTNNVIAAFNLARSEAIRSNRGGGVCPSADGLACEGTDWNKGFIAFTDQDGGGTWSPGDKVIRFFEPNDALAFSAVPLGAAGTTVEVIPFDRTGRPKTRAQLTVKAATCKTGQEYVRVIELGPAGQTRMKKDTCA
ncbi:GspH/FimT family pseudopilin [Lysobacter auxotrophicus]|uniref:Type II secretion system protein H n=1 Tax=Lysobacter auxotrophicus TaxID=2992573 RepID=A0ABN6UME9_9GAMM|nr:GspH/FimT family pseudopilin [Lysobacter auxotrophicus]BDU17575.1 GspH/FimT family pseudopilin [Lysobacter auxotrophicus]